MTPDSPSVTPVDAPEEAVPSKGGPLSAVAGYLRGPWTIAVYTFREGIRKKTLVGFLILSLLVIFGSSFMAAFLDPSSVGAAMGDLKTDAGLKLVKEICVSTISIFGVLITIFISASVVPSEIESRVIYTVLSKPLRRFQYLLGKFIGIQLIVLLNLLLMTALFFAALWVREGVAPTLLLWSTLLTYFEFLIVSAFTFALSCAASSPVLPTIGGLFIWLTGNLTEYLRDVHNRAGQTGEALDQFIGQVANALHAILPNLQNFSLKTQILHGAINDPPTNALIPNLVLYGLVYALFGFLLSQVIFWRREM